MKHSALAALAFLATAACSEPRAGVSPAGGPTVQDIAVTSASLPARPVASGAPDATRKELVPAAPAVRDASLRAIGGHWRIVAYDGAPVDDRGTPGTDPRDARSYMAGSSMELDGDHFVLRRGAATNVDSRIVVLDGSDRSHVAFTMGHGASSFDLVGEHDAKFHIDTFPPHDARLRRD
jgi:hypothetical protein